MAIEFHRYEGWPPKIGATGAPRLTESEARAYVNGFVLSDERYASGHKGYCIRQYCKRETGEYRYIGGIFSGW